jgi:hypothetical protein
VSDKSGVTEKPRVYARYGDREYAVSDFALSELQEEVAQALAAGRPLWITVFAGEGRATPAQLLISPGVPLVLREERETGIG